jgi:CheY-like chemotaxis protein
MKLATQLATNSIASTRTEKAEECCRLAKQLQKIGEYESACEALGEFWQAHDGSPVLDGLDTHAAAEILLRVGNLSGWLASRHRTGSQEQAKDLITQSIEIFEGLQRIEKVAEAQSDMALCYWREGAFNEARDLLREVIKDLGDGANDLRATALIRRAVVEKTATRYSEALSFYKEASPLVQATSDHALKGSFHVGFGTLLNCMGVAEDQPKYIDQALIEFAAASYHFEELGHRQQCGRVENNLGFLYQSIGRFPEAHEHITRARRIFVSLGDQGLTAQVDDTRARALLAEGRFLEAERYARMAVKSLDKGDECSLLVEALTTHGVTLARLGKYSNARSQLDRAIEAGENCGDLEGAGRARLSIIEELSGQTSASEMASIYKSAFEILKRSQDPSAKQRLFASAATIIDTFQAAEAQGADLKSENWEEFSFKKEVHAFEKILLERALRDAGGSVTKASRLLGFKHHQSVIALLNTRHQELLQTRSTARKRRRHIVSEPKAGKKTATPATKRDAKQISVLHVEDNKEVAHVIKDFLSSEGMLVETCGNGLTALKWLSGDARYDVVIVDNDLPGLSGLELSRRVQRITHRRKTPIIMLSGDNIETEAWRAGVKEFLRKPQDIDRVASAVERLLTRSQKRIKA